MELATVQYNPLTPGFFADPYPHYAQLRSENPIHLTKLDFWVVTRYRDVIAGYEHPMLSRDMRLWKHFETWRRGPADGPLERMMANWIVMIDPPRHTPLRQIHEQVFDSALFRAAEQAVQPITDELLKPARDAGGFDAVADFADRIPVYLINHLLGLPREDWEQFVAWSRAIALTSEPQLTTKVLQAGRDAQEALYGYFRQLVAQRRVGGGDDLVTGLAITEADGKRLETEELIDSLIFLYQAGHPTSTQLMALGLHSLIRHPNELAQLRNNPAMLRNAIEELQRYDGPVQMNDRVAVQDFTFLGHSIQAGQVVRLCLGAANRDGEQFPDPDRLDLTRNVRGQLGYGHGLHACIGSALGRIQARIALGSLLSSAPNLRLATDKVRYLPSPSNRGVVALPVEF